MVISRRNARKSRYLVNSFEVAFARLAIVVSLTFFAFPGSLSNSPVGRALPPWDFVWNAGLGLAGILVLVGLWTGIIRIEVLGLSFLAGAVLILIVATAVVRGLSGVAGICLDAAIVEAAARRMWVIIRFRHLPFDEDS